MKIMFFKMRIETHASNTKHFYRQFMADFLAEILVTWFYAVALCITYIFRPG